ncbi:MAG: 50S ribosomal protein L35 [Alicyclobacillaceae bacterium]|jgi:large subunit ribosomal protein L35|uniref:50S ribosomal protein L35 n=1 Tax=Alicyclobacillus sp. SP_1 TaxID=2942475 RepID=UPI002157F79D|nr:50S ribosomal protein L35 [Alicyclobacillus sp. SP_1]MCY0888074.1 50S ribosomal protein L35 [Alicyclobacillaceae bacterium]MCY0895641.1 50S ribosomal protein L35 [Alicyclobacillaceae bacterium]
MPKMKTHSGLAKRVKRTGSGKLKRAHAFAYHKAETKSSKRKRNLRGTTLVSNSDMKRIKQMVPYL